MTNKHASWDNVGPLVTIYPVIFRQS